MRVNSHQHLLEKVWEFIKRNYYIALAVFVPYILGMHVFIFAIIPSKSMEPNYPAGSVSIANRLIDKTELSRGQAIFFDHEGMVFLKRVVGLPGDTVELRDGYVYINGALLDESGYLDASVRTHPAANGPSCFDVPSGTYFLLGDNRENSYDARFWSDPFVEYDLIYGRMIGAVKLPFWK